MVFGARRCNMAINTAAFNDITSEQSSCEDAVLILLTHFSGVEVTYLVGAGKLPFWGKTNCHLRGQVGSTRNELPIPTPPQIISLATPLL